jgi:flavin-dependent dehydrogenase
VCPDQIDVAVIGAGPAGAWCAALLAQAGARVALVGHVGSRPSSVELMSARARWTLRDLAPAGVEVHETVSVWNGGAPRTRDCFWDPYGPALAVERDQLDSALRLAAARAGATVIDQKVTALARDDGGWRIGRALTADWVVVATGCGLPALGRRGRTVLPQRAILTRYRGEGLPRLCIERTARGWMYSLPAPRGGALLGLCTPAATDLEMVVASSTLFRELAGWPRSAWWSCAASVRQYQDVTGPQWIAIGNAAFTPDPLTGAGLWFALDSARAAADVVLGRSTAAAYAGYVSASVQSHHQSRREMLEDR